MMIKINNLNCYRGNQLILERVNLSISLGQCIIIRGANGSGKTTLLRYIANLVLDHSGAIDRNTDKIGYLGHYDGIKLNLSVLENLQFWADLYNAHTLSSVVQDLGLANLLDRRSGHLSAGQKRKLGLARLLIAQDDLWVMDEPTVSLDQKTTEFLTKLVQCHCSAKGAAVIATHIDIGIKNSITLDITQYQPIKRYNNDPFLNEAII